MERSLALLMPYSGSGEAIVRFCAVHGLPLQASLSVALAANAALALKQRCMTQWKLPWQEAAKLISCRDPLNMFHVAQGLKFAQINGLPLDTLYCILQQGRPPHFGVLSHGWRLRAQADPRILKEAGPTNQESGVIGAMPFVRVLYQVEFWNGESYRGVGMADGNDRQVKERGTSVMAGIAETRAANHAYRMALRLPYIADAEEEKDET